MQEGFPVSQRGGTAALHMTTSANDEAQSTAARPKEEGGGQDVLSGRTFHIRTFGCQMNARDSEKLRGMLEYVGFSESPDEDCDIVIYNTCTVRENANQKVYGRLGELKGKKKKNPFMKVVICGCMMEEKAEEERIKTSYPFVDIVFGTMNLSEFPRLLLKNLKK